MINIQSAVFNTYGVLDNLAHIWVSERSVVGSNGKPLSNGRIGLDVKKDVARSSFPKPIQNRLAEMDPWLENLETFRHALAHRVPLYIPPFCVNPNNIELYNSLERQCIAARNRGDVVELQNLRQQQCGLKHFKPFIQHSIYSDQPPIVFHPQLLADFNTIEDITTTILDELGVFPFTPHKP